MYVQRQKEKHEELFLGVDRSRWETRSENERTKQNKRTHRLKLLQQLLPVVDRSGHVARIYNTFVLPFATVPALALFTPSRLSLSFVDVQRVRSVPNTKSKLRKFVTRVGNFQPDVHAGSYENGYSRRSRTSRTRFWLRTRLRTQPEHRENTFLLLQSRNEY